MYIMYLIGFFIFGTLMGSFYTVIGLRLPKKESFILGHSRCDNCNHDLKLYEMIPIFSYLFQKGKCRYCHKKISAIMPTIEFLTGVLFTVAFYSFGINLDLILALGLISLLMIVVVSDLTYLVIPDSILIFFSLYFIIVQLFRIGPKDTFIHILTGIFLFVVMYLIMCFGNKTFKKESMGGGDIKMMFLFGLILDPLLGLISIFLGSLLALPMSLVLFFSKKEHVIPFGPFLLLALVALFFTKLTANNIISWFRF